ncbi:NrfD/PsrC family molybdoenzyme membrane anchor subunit [Thermoproteus tenax]|uniref:Sulfur (Polysulfide) reductase, membrane subunit n=1 Tax=Thermoproteus tenax (strain ATCC 35583 / DSM 2078 / JCM 9277 / NBRC 100435 / Kra 1) TaxID=768679 RepID=G4RQ86_THETK|nr:NrfD/PsrC family molybdoenzyme membrane anchor subunit [Thermoproteus tenax]CCC80723.1 sulfur (polysulfide) reductase, membrane subunit [Thermoproteus tenax Kra 1]
MSQTWPVSWSGWGPYMPPDFEMIWGWRIAAAVFFTALGAMSMLLAAFYEMRKIKGLATKYGMLAGWVFIIIALAFFVIDLGRPDRAGNIIFIGWPNGRLAQSWMDWGVMFLGGMFLWGLIYLASQFVKAFQRPILMSALYFLIIITAVLSTVYTAFLFSAAGGKSYWWNGSLPLLWLSSGLGYGAAFMLLLARFVKLERGSDLAKLRHFIHELSWIDLLAVIFEAFAWIIFLSVAYANHMETRIPLTQLLFVNYAPYFWGFVVTLGIAIPLLLEIALMRTDPLGKFAAYAVPIIFLAVMIGGYTLRYIVVATAYYYSPFTPLTEAVSQWGPWWS